MTIMNIHYVVRVTSNCALVIGEDKVIYTVHNSQKMYTATAVRRIFYLCFRDEIFLINNEHH
jgi:hypothetical protein